MDIFEIVTFGYVVVLTVVSLCVSFGLMAHGPIRTTPRTCNWLVAGWVVAALLIFGAVPLLVGKVFLSGVAVTVVGLLLYLRASANRYLAGK